jgi:hypothetical protein
MEGISTLFALIIRVILTPDRPNHNLYQSFILMLEKHSSECWVILGTTILALSNVLQEQMQVRITVVQSERQKQF